MTAELHVDQIDASNRHRSDLGDIRALADSIDTIGLIHPVVVTPDNKLVAGGRRLAAMKSLGWESIPVTVIHTLNGAVDALQAELDENTCRKDLNPVEAANLRKAREVLIRPLAAAAKAEAIKNQPRDAKGRVGPSASSKLDEAASSRATRKVAARGTGYSGSTLDKVDAVIKTAEDDEAPEPVREVARQALNEIQNTGKVDGPFKRTEAAKQDNRLADLLGNDADIARAKYRQAFTKALGNYLELLSFDPAQVADALDAQQWQVVPMQIDGVNQWWEQVRSHRASLKVVGGSNV